MLACKTHFPIPECGCPLILTREMKIEGMSCEHCAARVEKALSELGVAAQVDLAGKKAVITMENAVADDDLVKAVVDAGYEVVGLE